MNDPEIIEDQPLPKISLEILDVIKTAQEKNGLRQDDYLKYRHYLTKRGHRIRKSLKFTHGKAGKFVKHEITGDTCTDSRHLLLLLCKAERAWAHAMQRIEENEAERNKRKEEMEERDGNVDDVILIRGDHHARRLLYKASKLAKNLEAVSQVVADNRTILEAQAYSSWIQGNAYFGTKKWKEAVDHFTVAKTIYEKLAQIALGGHKALYSLRVGECETRIRLCEYSFKLENHTEIDRDELLDMQAAHHDLIGTRINGLLDESRTKQAETLTSVEFQGRVIELSSESVRKAVLRIQESAYELRRQQSAVVYKDEPKMSDVSLYDSMLMACSDGLSLMEKEISTVSGKRKGAVAVADAERKELDVISKYMKRILLFFTIERNSLMISVYERIVKNTENQTRAKEGGLEGPRIKTTSTSLPQGLTKLPVPLDIARLYEKLLQNLEDLSGLVTELEHSIVSEGGMSGTNTQELQQISAVSTLTKSHRMYFVAKMHHRSKGWENAIALLDHADEMVHSGLSSLNKCLSKSEKKEEEKEKGGEQIIGELCIDVVNEKKKAEDRLTKMRELRCCINADCVLKDEIETVITETKTMNINDKSDALIDRLNRFEGGSKPSFSVLALPPSLEAVPMKPVVFDLAGAYIEGPDLDGRINEKKSGGWFGFWR